MKKVIRITLLCIMIISLISASDCNRSPGSPTTIDGEKIKQTYEITIDDRFDDMTVSPETSVPNSNPDLSCRVPSFRISNQHFTAKLTVYLIDKQFNTGHPEYDNQRMRVIAVFTDGVFDFRLQGISPLNCNVIAPPHPPGLPDPPALPDLNLRINVELKYVGEAADVYETNGCIETSKFDFTRFSFTQNDYVDTRISNEFKDKIQLIIDKKIANKLVEATTLGVKHADPNGRCQNWHYLTP